MKSIILAAGQGSRMKSDTPKPLLKIGGKPMLRHVIDALKQTYVMNPEDINVVYSQVGIAVKETDYDDVVYSEQKTPNGTGDAVRSAISVHPVSGEDVLILYGDVPLITPKTIEGLVAAKGDSDLALLSVCLGDPNGYGRIVRDDNGDVVGVVEQKDASDQEKLIDEVNTGIMLVSGDKLTKWTSALDNNNAQGEYYLTDIVAMAAREGDVVCYITEDEDEVAGANDRVQMADLETIYQERQVVKAMVDGLAVIDPTRVDIRGDLKFGRNCEIDINVIIEGSVVLGDNVTVGAGSILKNCVIEDDTKIHPYTLIEDTKLGRTEVVGAFAKIKMNNI